MLAHRTMAISPIWSILNSNPLDDIAHASDIDTVIKNGVVYPADSILR